MPASRGFHCFLAWRGSHVKKEEGSVSSQPEKHPLSGLPAARAGRTNSIPCSAPSKKVGCRNSSSLNTIAMSTETITLQAPAE